MGATGAAFIGGPNREEIERRAYFALTLDSFEANNPNYVQVNDKNQKEYLENRLVLFLRKAIEADVVKKFGPLPDSNV